MNIIDVFTSLAFALIAIGTQAIMQTLGRITLALRPEWYKRSWFRAFVASQNLFWGAVLAELVEMPDIGRGERLLVGLIAGFMSLSVYEIVLKRFEATAVKAAPTTE
jgi:hypothetical protein